MLLTIRHQTRYRYDSAGSHAVQRLRLTPAGNAAQTVHSWAIDAPGMENAATYTDGLGNITHLISQAEPDEELIITASGQVTTTDTGGVLGALNEVANPTIFLRPTALTQSSAGIDAINHFEIEVTDLDHLNKVMTYLRKVQGVYKVERLKQ